VATAYISAGRIGFMIAWYRTARSPGISNGYPFITNVFMPRIYGGVGDLRSTAVRQAPIGDHQRIQPIPN
jgi:hypothetical protein